MPASTIAVKSPGSCSSTRFRRAVERTTSPPSRSIETRPPLPSSSDAAAIDSGSKTLDNAGPLEWMRAIRARHLAAKPRRREHLAGIGKAFRIERRAQQRHRGEIALAEELGHRARLVDADAVLTGER